MNKHIALLYLGSLIILVTHVSYTVLAADRFLTWSMYMIELRFLIFYYAGWAMFLYSAYVLIKEELKNRKQG